MKDKIALSTRLGSMLVDHLIMCLIIVPPLVILKELEPFRYPVIKTVLFWIGILIYLNKDFVFGRSIAKRVFGLVVTDNKTNKPASSLKCFIRNLTIPLWPLEVLISLFAPKRRLGDLMANTRLERTDKAPWNSIIRDFKLIKTNMGMIQILFIGIIYSVGLNFLLEGLAGR